MKHIIRRVVRILERSTEFCLLGEQLFLSDHIPLRIVPAKLGKHFFILSPQNLKNKGISTPCPSWDSEYFACSKRMRHDLGVYYETFLKI